MKETEEIKDVTCCGCGAVGQDSGCKPDGQKLLLDELIEQNLMLTELMNQERSSTLGDEGANGGWLGTALNVGGMAAFADLLSGGRITTALEVFWDAHAASLFSALKGAVKPLPGLLMKEGKTLIGILLNGARELPGLLLNGARALPGLLLNGARALPGLLMSWAGLSVLVGGMLPLEVEAAWEFLHGNRKEFPEARENARNHTTPYALYKTNFADNLNYGRMKYEEMLLMRWSDLEFALEDAEKGIRTMTAEERAEAEKFLRYWRSGRDGKIEWIGEGENPLDNLFRADYAPEPDGSDAPWESRRDAIPFPAEGAAVPSPKEAAAEVPAEVTDDRALAALLQQSLEQEARRNETLDRMAELVEGLRDEPAERVVNHYHEAHIGQLTIQKRLDFEELGAMLTEMIFGEIAAAPNGLYQ